MSRDLREIFLIEKDKWAAKSYIDIDRREWEEQVNYEVLDGEHKYYFEVLVLEHTNEYIHVVIGAWDTLMSSLSPLSESIIYKREESADE